MILTRSTSVHLLPVPRNRWFWWCMKPFQDYKGNLKRLENLYGVDECAGHKPRQIAYQTIQLFYFLLLLHSNPISEPHNYTKYVRQWQAIRMTSKEATCSIKSRKLNTTHDTPFADEIFWGSCRSILIAFEPEPWPERAWTATVSSTLELIGNNLANYGCAGLVAT